MRTSTRKTTTAILREILGIKDFEMAGILDRSIHTIHSLESGRLKLSLELATKIFHETGISLDWLLKGDPGAPPMSGRGERYTKELFERAQAEKMYYDRPHPFFQKTDALDCCARLAGVLKNASDHGKYYMAKYKLRGALSALEKEFGQEKEMSSIQKQIDLLNPLVAHGEKEIKSLLNLLVPHGEKQIKSPLQSKQLSKKKRRR
jgi:transcriptional regulator with XRE-family HTH domain